MTDERTPVSKSVALMILFIGLAATLAIAVNIAGAAVGLGPEWRLALFALVVVGLALIFGRIRPLDSTHADLTFNLLAVLGIVLLFFDAGGDRQRIVLAGEYARATGTRDAFVHKRPELERVLGNVGLLLEKFRVAATAPETIARRDKALKDCRSLQIEQAVSNMKRQLEDRQRRIQAVPVSPGSPTPYQVPRLDGGAVPPVDCDKMVVSRADLDALETVTTPGDLVDILRRQSGPDIKDALGLDLGTLTIEDVTTFLDRARSDTDVRAVLAAEQRRLDTNVADLRAAFEALGPSVERGPRVIAWLRQFLWPYVLLCAIGLMMSTKDYLTLGTSANPGTTR
jgi:hypothetical protein